MQVFYDIRDIKQTFKNLIMTIGVFDGVHRGHQYLIHETVKRARIVQGTAMVMTFYPHPVRILRPDVYLPLLVSLSTRMKLIEAQGVDLCLAIRFTKRFAQITPLHFIGKYIVDRLNAREIFIGEDFRFGVNRSGHLESFQMMGQKFGFKVNVVPRLRMAGQAVGSTRVRHLIAEGNMSQASKLLGRPFSLPGKVIRGDARGRILGYPTANIQPLQEAIPPCGVYAVRVLVDDKRWPGMANIGQRPSFVKDDPRITIEVHIFNFHKDIYGKEIIVEFIRRIRDERVFATQEELIKQLKVDERRIKAKLSSLTP